MTTPTDGLDGLPPLSPVSSEPAKKGNRKRTILIVAAVVIGLVAVCTAGVGYFFVGALNEADDVEAVTEDFMAAMSRDDFTTAYAYFSDDLQSEVSLARFSQELGGTPGYSDFVSLKRSNWRKNWSNGSTTFTFQGDVTYLQGDHGVLDAVFVKEDGAWKFVSIYVKR